MMVYENTTTKRFADDYVWPIDDLPQPSGQSQIKIGVGLPDAPHAVVDEIGQRTEPCGKAAVDGRCSVEYADFRSGPQEVQHRLADVSESVDGGRERCNKCQLFRHAGSPTMRVHPSIIC